MSQLFVIGRVVGNLEPKPSAKQRQYIRFTLQERIGYGESSHPQYIQVWAWGYQAQKLLRLGVQAGSLIWVSGSLELEEYVKQDGKTQDKRLKLKMSDGDYVPGNGGFKKATDKPAAAEGTAETAGTIDGERESLPE